MLVASARGLLTCDLAVDTRIVLSGLTGVVIEYVIGSGAPSKLRLSSMESQLELERRHAFFPQLVSYALRMLGGLSHPPADFPLLFAECAHVSRA